MESESWSRSCGVRVDSTSPIPRLHIPPIRQTCQMTSRTPIRILTFLKWFKYSPLVQQQLGSVRPLFVQHLFVQRVLVQSFTSNPIRLGQVRIGRKALDQNPLDEMVLDEKQVYRWGLPLVDEQDLAIFVSKSIIILFTLIVTSFAWFCCN